MALSERSSILYWILGVRLMQSSLMPILTDCDEVFNYWEPLHYLHYGYGMQTWEYSPEFSIRSWLYILLHYIPGIFGRVIFGFDKMMVFYFTRSLLAVFCAFAESKLIKSVRVMISPKVANYLFWFLILSPGMFISSSAFLPSSFAMIMTTLALSQHLNHDPRSIRAEKTGVFKLVPYLIFYCVGAVIGWPFSVAVGIPYVLYVGFLSIFHNCKGGSLQIISKWLFGFFTTLILVLGFEVICDYVFYRKWLLVPYNIVYYNVFSPHGPELYGTEGWTFYPKNLFLNFNIVWPLSCFSALLWIINRKEGENNPRYMDYLFMICIPLIFWQIIFFAQPHKEERFMFVIYPLICLNASLSVFWAENQLKSKFSKDNLIMMVRFLKFIFYFMFVTLSLSRILALHWHYSQGTMNLYHDIYNMDHKELNGTTLCLSDEWYRFASHFMLPNNMKLSFVDGMHFQAQLPKPFPVAQTSSNFVDSPGDKNIKMYSSVKNWLDQRPGTFLSVPGFNMMNRKESLGRFVENPCKDCDFFIDIEDDISSSKQALMLRKNFKRLICHRLIVPSAAPVNSNTKWIDRLTDIFNRAYFLPFDPPWSLKNWKNYCLFESQHENQGQEMESTFNVETEEDTEIQ